MGKIEEARQLLKKIGMPKKQWADVCCYVLVAMAGLRENDDWNTATNKWVRIHDIIQFVGDNYGVIYAENSRETIRKQALHHFRTAALVEDNGKVTNSPNYKYRLTKEALRLIHSIGGNKEENNINRFIKYHEKLIKVYSSKKEMTKLPVKINSEDLFFQQANIMNCRKQLSRNLLQGMHQIRSAFILATQ